MLYYKHKSTDGARAAKGGYFVPEKDKELQTPPAEETLAEEVEEQHDEESVPKKKSEKKPIWAILALVLIGLSTVALLVLANIQLRVQQRTSLFEKNLTPVKIATEDAALWGYLSETGELAIPAVYEEAFPFAQNGLAAVKKNGAWGYVNTEGEEVISCTLEDTLGFDDDALAPAKLYGMWGYINKNGDFSIPPQFDSAHHFAGCGLALVGIDKKCGYITRNGDYAILPQYTAACDFDQDGYAAVFALGKWGVIDKNGDFAINPRFEEIGTFSESGVAPVKLGGKYGFIDRDGRYVLAPTLAFAEEFSNGLAVVQPEENGPFGYIDEQGETVIPARYDKALPFAENGLAAVAINDPASADPAAMHWGYINAEGTLVIEPTLDYATTFCAGLAAVYRNGAYAYINEQGESVIELSADCLMAGRFTDDGYALLLCDDPALENPLYDYVIIINENGEAIHTQRLLTIAPALLLYGVTP